MIEDIKVLGTVQIGEAAKTWLKLSEDVGGMTLIGTFVRTDTLKEVNKVDDDA
jgi:hypothetical protein